MIPIVFIRSLSSHLKSEYQSRIYSYRPLKLHCEFPKDYYISLLLLSFAIALAAIASEFCFFIAYSLWHSIKIFSFASTPYLLAYVLINILFAAHFIIYFCYQEEIEIEGDSFRLSQKFLFLHREWTFEREQLFFYQIKHNIAGSLYIELYYFTETGQAKKLFFGSYLNEEHVEVLASYLRKLFFQANFCPKS